MCVCVYACVCKNIESLIQEDITIIKFLYDNKLQQLYLSGVYHNFNNMYQDSFNSFN